MVAENPKPISELPTEEQAKAVKNNVEKTLMAIPGTNSVGVGLRDAGDHRERAIVVNGEFGDGIPSSPTEIDGIGVIFKNTPKVKSQ